MNIAPQVGMPIWYRPYDTERIYATSAQPFTAVITHVFSDTCVNLTIANETGVTLYKQSVTLCQEHPAQPGEAEWAPHQRRAATMQAALEQLVCGMAA